MIEHVDTARAGFPDFGLSPEQRREAVF